MSPCSLSRHLGDFSVRIFHFRRTTDLKSTIALFLILFRPDFHFFFAPFLSSAVFFLSLGHFFHTPYNSLGFYLFQRMYFIHPVNEMCAAAIYKIRFVFRLLAYAWITFSFWGSAFVMAFCVPAPSHSSYLGEWRKQVEKETITQIKRTLRNTISDVVLRLANVKVGYYHTLQV